MVCWRLPKLSTHIWLVGWLCAVCLCVLSTYSQYVLMDCEFAHFIHTVRHIYRSAQLSARLNIQFSWVSEGRFKIASMPNVCIYPTKSSACVEMLEVGKQKRTAATVAAVCVRVFLACFELCVMNACTFWLGTMCLYVCLSFCCKGLNSFDREKSGWSILR